MADMIIAIVVMVVATQITRFLPFVLFKRIKPPQFLLNAAQFIPGAVMAVLVLTSLPALEIPAVADTEWRPWAAALITAGLHLAMKNPLVSIFGGTASYMLLLSYA